MNNTLEYRNNFSQNINDVHTFSKEMDLEYTSFLDENEHALVRTKQEVSFLEAIQAKQKET